MGSGIDDSEPVRLVYTYCALWRGRVASSTELSWPWDSDKILPLLGIRSHPGFLLIAPFGARLRVTAFGPIVVLLRAHFSGDYRGYTSFVPIYVSQTSLLEASLDSVYLPSLGRV